MRERFAIGPRTYFLISAVALGALTLIVFTGAAVRVTGSGLGCPSWPNCYDNGRLVAETNSHALIEFGNRTLTSFVGIAAGAAGLMAFFRAPFRRDLAILGVDQTQTGSTWTATVTIDQRGRLLMPAVVTATAGSASETVTPPDNAPRPTN